MKIKAKAGQNFLDIILRASGKLDDAVQFAVLNNISITDIPNDRQDLEWPEKPVGPEPATYGDAKLFFEELKGIGEMIIEKDFKVR